LSQSEGLYALRTKNNEESNKIAVTEKKGEKSANQVTVCIPTLFLNFPIHKYSRLQFILTRSEYTRVFFQQDITDFTSNKQLVTLECQLLTLGNKRQFESLHANENI